MWVQFGNDHAIEAYRDSASDAPELVRYRPAPGQRITATILPDGWGVSEAFATVLKAVEQHFDADPDTDDRHPPAWVESSSSGLAALLADHFGIQPDSRPKGWHGDHPSVAVLKAGESHSG